MTKIIQLDFDLNRSSIEINADSINGIHFDLLNNNLYVALHNNNSISIYHTNDEITFNKIHTISTSYNLRSITINNDKIYTGTSNGAILVFNKTNNALIQVMSNICSSGIRSVKYDCNGNMICSCNSPPMIKIIGANGINSTILLNNLFTSASEIYIDSKNRLWITGKYGFVIYK
jgi:hypothetical protein